MEKKEKKHPKGKGCWYMRYITECVLCGAGEDEKFRMWTPKPEHMKDRIHHHQFACDAHF